MLSNFPEMGHHNEMDKNIDEELPESNYEDDDFDME